MRGSSGYTIVEVLVMSVVALVVFGLLFNVFLVALQRTEDGRIMVDLQQEAMFCIVRWEKDLERSSVNRGIQVQGEEPRYIGVLSASGVASNGTVVWENRLARWCYSPSNRTLSRGVFLTGSNLIVHTSPLPLAGLIEAPGEIQRTFCEDVEEFSLKDRNGNAEHFQDEPLVFRLKLRRALSVSQRYAEFTVERRYTLRNTF